jgi:hypothetical protein
VPHANGVYRHTEVICSGLFNAVEKYIFIVMLQHLYIQVNEVLMEHKPGRMKTLFIYVYGRICVLSRN